MFANPHRGEVLLTLGSTQYKLRPSFEALAMAEQSTGSLIALVERAGSGQILIGDIVSLLHACAVAGGHDVAKDDFAAQILDAGVSVAAVPMQQLLKTIMTGTSGDS